MVHAINRYHTCQCHTRVNVLAFDFTMDSTKSPVTDRRIVSSELASSRVTLPDYPVKLVLDPAEGEGHPNPVTSDHGEPMICNHKRPEAAADVCDKRYAYDPRLCFYTVRLQYEKNFNRR